MRILTKVFKTIIITLLIPFVLSLASIWAVDEGLGLGIMRTYKSIWKEK